MSKRNLIIGSIVIVLIILGIVLNGGKNVESIEINNREQPQATSYQIVVDIKGEVKNPGLYYLNNSSRVIDAINIAGGMTSFADIDKINLATPLEDGMVVNVFRKSVEKKESKISINTASVDELTKLTGVGESKAKSIIEYRNKNGYFMSLEALKKVDGITEKIYNDNKEFICL